MAAPFYLVIGAVCALASADCKGGCKSSGAGAGADAAPVPIPAAHAAYITNNGSDSLTVIDRRGAQAVTVAVDLDPNRHEAPHHLAVDAAAGRVFVALAFPPEPGKKKDPHGGHGQSDDRGKLAKLDLATLAVATTRDVDESPGEIILTRDKKKVVVTHYDMKRAMTVAAKGGASPATMFARILVFDAATMEPAGERPLCVAPHGAAMMPDDRAVLVACYGSDELAVVDLGSPQLPVSRFPLGGTPGVPGVPRYGPYSVAIAPKGDLAVVANLESSDIRVFEPAQKRFRPDGDVALGARAFMPAFVSDRVVLVPLQSPDGIARVELDKRTIEMRASYEKAECELPHAVRVAKDGRAYVVCEGDHTRPGAVLEIDPVTLATKRRWTVGVYPDGIDFGE
jgi:DNA-binding beta-propeller fold protein YncE